MARLAIAQVDPLKCQQLQEEPEPEPEPEPAPAPAPVSIMVFGLGKGSNGSSSRSGSRSATPSRGSPPRDSPPSRGSPSSRLAPPASGSGRSRSPSPSRLGPPRAGTPQSRSPSPSGHGGSATHTSAHVAIYDVYDERDPNHWAIWLTGPRGDVILQVEDDKKGDGYFVAIPIYGKTPQRSTRLKGEPIVVGTIPGAEQDTAVAIIQGTPVDNRSTTWNCQSWVMEALEALSHAGVFTWHNGAKGALQAKRQNWQ